MNRNVFDLFDITHTHATWAWDNYRSSIFQLIEKLDYDNVMEIGAGRFPLLTKDEVDDLSINYTINDISESILSEVSEPFKKICFDISRIILEVECSVYDLMFSKMVF